MGLAFPPGILLNIDLENVDMSVDMGTFAHKAFSDADIETPDEVVNVLQADSKDWGSPLGILCNHGCGNLSKKTREYLKPHGIKMVSSGVSRSKGNGSD